MTRETLLSALPDWALVIESGMPDAPYVGFHRFGNRVFATTAMTSYCSDENDACNAMAQLVGQCAPPKSRSVTYPTHCTVTVFDDERDAQTFMRDVKRLTRQHGNACKRSSGMEIPV